MLQLNKFVSIIVMIARHFDKNFAELQLSTVVSLNLILIIPAICVGWMKL